MKYILIAIISTSISLGISLPTKPLTEICNSNADFKEFCEQMLENYTKNISFFDTDEHTDCMNKINLMSCAVCFPESVQPCQDSCQKIVEDCGKVLQHDSLVQCDLFSLVEPCTDMGINRTIKQESEVLEPEIDTARNYSRKFRIVLTGEIELI